MATVSPDSVAQDQIKAFVERIERLEEERKAIARDIAEVYAEAKGNGFDRKALKAVVRIRAQDHASRMEHEALVELYLSALGMASSLDDDSDDFAIRASHVHVHVHEDLPDHDPETGEVVESNPQHGAGGAEDEAAVAANVAPSSAQPITEKHLPAPDQLGSGAETQHPEVARSIPAPATNAAPRVDTDQGASQGGIATSALLVHDFSKPNPWCQDPDDCGVHASWNHTCGSCLRLKAQREAAGAVQ